MNKQELFQHDKETLAYERGFEAGTKAEREKILTLVKHSKLLKVDKEYITKQLQHINS